MHARRCPGFSRPSSVATTGQVSEEDCTLTFELPATTAAARWLRPKKAAGRSFSLNGEKSLLLAVLEDAVETFQHYVIASDRRDHALFADVAAWFASGDTQWMFSFVPICDALGFDVAYVRSGLRRWRDTHCASLDGGATPPSLVPPDERRAAPGQRPRGGILRLA